jgi:hypothetical protein
MTVLLVRILLGLTTAIPIVTTVVCFLKRHPNQGTLGAVACLLQGAAVALTALEAGPARFGLSAGSVVVTIFLGLGWAPILGAIRPAQPGSWWWRNRKPRAGFGV